MPQAFRELVVWQKAMQLAVGIYKLAEGFPRAEQFRLTDQLLRAVASVPANIAEGNARTGRKDYAHFLSIAKGSLAETETFLLLAVELGFTTTASTQPLFTLADEVDRMLTALHRNILATA